MWQQFPAPGWYAAGNMQMAQSHTMRSHGRSDVGRRRATNQDAFLCDDDLGLWVVADGMGGRSGGRKASDWDAVAWGALAAELGAGELLVTSMDADGVQDGYDLELVRTICETVDVPVVASGGAGRPSHLADALEAGAEAALAASIFHDGTHTVEEVKETCRERGLPVR